MTNFGTEIDGILDTITSFKRVTKYIPRKKLFTNDLVVFLEKLFTVTLRVGVHILLFLCFELFFPITSSVNSDKLLFVVFLL